LHTDGIYLSTANGTKDGYDSPRIMAYPNAKTELYDFSTNIIVDLGESSDCEGVIELDNNVTTNNIEEIIWKPN
jgi:hypothetical protein